MPGLATVQTITLEGEKRFLSGGRMASSYYVVDDAHRTRPAQRIIICEGVATAHSIYAETQHGRNTLKTAGVEPTGSNDRPPVVVAAMNAGNLQAVALEMRRLVPLAQIEVWGDNDSNGVGQAAAQKAAQAVDVVARIPPTQGMDWNDWVNAELDALNAWRSAL